jgi:hypothetical protein
MALEGLLDQILATCAISMEAGPNEAAVSRIISFASHWDAQLP